MPTTARPACPGVRESLVGFGAGPRASLPLVGSPLPTQGARTVHLPRLGSLLQPGRGRTGLLAAAAFQGGHRRLGLSIGSWRLADAVRSETAAAEPLASVVQ